MDDQNTSDIINEAKEKICEDTGMTKERLEELTGVMQDIMNEIKIKLAPIDSNFERGFVLSGVKERCDYASRIYIIDAMSFNANQENDSREKHGS